MIIDNLQALRALYPAAGERARLKQLASLDTHMRSFIALSPLCVLATHGVDELPDASPRGGEPGFVQVADDHTLWLPDAPGNHRLDALQNIVATGRVGLLFMVPGVDETLRVNGLARLTTDPATCARCADARRTPPLVIEVTVREAYLHCAKALMRARLWHAASQVPRERLPSMGQMLRDQIGGSAPAETQAEMLARYQASL
jgi:uncharacterized protein